MAKLIIKDLYVSVKGTSILRGLNLELDEGETVALLGPNGHGKSTLLAVIMGDPKFTVDRGSITFDGQDVLALSPDKRSQLGLFLGMQYPAEIPGLNSADFYKAAMNSHREKPMALFQFYRELEKAYKEVGIPFEMNKRNLNEGFSGGEKKRNEILQMRLLKPRFAMLDEIDSGLDVDAINTVSDVINEEHERGAGLLVISHYARLLDLIKPTRAVILINGKIVVDGGPEIIKRVDTEGYEWIKNELGIEIAKEINAPMNEVSIGVCATREAVKNEK